MGKKQKKKVTQRKKMPQKSCIAEIEGDETGIDRCSCILLNCICKGYDSESEDEEDSDQALQLSLIHI